MRIDPKIPTLMHSFFKWYCKPDRYEELHGDLEEIFYARAAKSGLRIARLMYIMDVIRCCQPYAWRRRTADSTSGLILYRSYFTVAVRGLMKNPVNSFINVFGLSVAIGICILVYGYFQWDHDIDRFHQNKNEVFLVTWLGGPEANLQRYGTSPQPVGEILRHNFAHIKKTCRIQDRNVVVKYQNNVFHEQARFADPEFLDMLTFPLKWGHAQSLHDLNSIILSEDMSVKYFGQDNPIGKDLLIKFDEQNGKVFKVAGVAKRFPKSHDLEFQFLINFQNLGVAWQDYKLDDWGKLLTATFIQVDGVASVEQIERDLDRYRVLQNAALPEFPVKSFSLQQLATLHEKSADIRDCVTHDDNREGRIGLPVIALLMLALACFNYINIAIVSATKRLKEIGVRKVIGATRLRMVGQFLSENIITTFFALAFGFLLSVTLFIPWFEQFSGGSMLFDIYHVNLFVFLAGLLIFTGFISGLYPAIYISRFDAVRIFRGSVEFGRKSPLTKLFLGIQMILACVLITTGVVFTQNNKYQSELSWGYDQKNVLYSTLPDTDSFAKLDAAMTRVPGVEMISGSADQIGKGSSTAIIALADGRQFETEELRVDANYFATLGFSLVEGSVFREHSENDKHAVVVNELLATTLGLTNLKSANIEIDKKRYDVVGIVRDFHSRSPFNKIQPAVFVLADESDYHYLSIRVASGAEKQTYAALKNEWSKLFPEIPFQGGYQTDAWGSYFHQVDRSQTFSIIIATIAVFLAGLGLFGLVTINLSGRAKEFSIRKTLGANAGHIITVVVNQYVWLIGASLIIGVPVSYVFAQASLHMLFAYPIPMGFSGLAIATATLAIVFLSVVLFQIKKVLNVNPIEGLRVQ